MIHPSTFLLLIFLTFNASAQELSGIIKYKKLLHSSKHDAKIKDPQTTPEERKRLENETKTYRQIFEQTFVLDFNRDESYYKQEESLGISDKRTIQTVFDCYKNFKEDVYIQKVDQSYGNFLVGGKLPAYNWKLSEETKVFGEYTCYKASNVTEKNIREWHHHDGWTEEKIVKKPITTIAWYCPDLPVMNGPELFGGLPGLIMAVEDNAIDAANFSYSIQCIEVTLNPKSGVKIKRPTGRKIFTQKEFEDEYNKLTSKK